MMWMWRSDWCNCSYLNSELLAIIFGTEYLCLAHLLARIILVFFKNKKQQVTPSFSQISSCFYHYKLSCHLVVIMLLLLLTSHVRFQHTSTPFIVMKSLLPATVFYDIEQQLFGFQKNFVLIQESAKTLVAAVHQIEYNILSLFSSRIQHTKLFL
ncbi:hypothetical protein AMTRI_Chr03g48650 [Amborella trichopoda]